LNSSNQTFESEKRKFKYPTEFIGLLNIMHKKSWLSQYEKLEGLQMASTGLSKRISFENNLNEAVIVFKKYENILQNVFFEFMKDAQIKFSVQ
jgi:acyl carrier protein phosphodiesterase